MAFVGKLASLVLVPGLLFIVAMGLVARTVLWGMSSLATGAVPTGPATGVPGLTRLFSDEGIATDGALQALHWAAPIVKLMALSWATCIVFGYLHGDVILTFALLLIASGADLLLVYGSSNPRVRQNRFSEGARVLGWGVPLAFVLALVALRTGEVSLSGVIRWQASNGILIASTSGGALVEVGISLGLAAAVFSALCFSRMRPLSRGFFSDPPGGIASDVSGPPLAMLRLSDSASLFVAVLLMAALFFAGPASAPYEIAFWGLKVAGLAVLLGVVDMVSPDLSPPRALALSLGVGGTLALAGLVLVWIGVAS